MRSVVALLLLVSMFQSAGSIANAEETPVKSLVSYRTVKVDGRSIFYREAGRKTVIGHLPNAEIHIVDGGHFALDTAADEIARLVAAFVK